MYMLEIVFWLSLTILLYTYFGYPIYVFLRADKARYSIYKDQDYRPFVSVIISVYNEEARVGKKIENLLSSNYPADKLEIMVGSDGSTDGTSKILSEVRDKRVRSFIFQKRRGKVSVLNDLVANAKGEVLVFCDVRQMFDKDAIRTLVIDFADEKVGCVSGELVFRDKEESNRVSGGIGVYWNYEKFIRDCESMIYSMVGATGAIYAIKKNLYSPPPKNTILDDMYIPLAITRSEYRCILDRDAKAYDDAADTPEQEYKRKVRTLTGNYQIFTMFIDRFNPFRSIVAMPLFSHKFLRIVAPFFIILMFLSNLALFKYSFYSLLMIGQIIFYLLALIGSVTYKSNNRKAFARLLSTIYMFCFMNYTALVGFYRFVFSKQDIAWEK
jgi:poly-beta-1,6-N-acetyl-D-glucosamine synthase